jgi:hypothetical protein
MPKKPSKRFTTNWQKNERKLKDHEDITFLLMQEEINIA